MFQKKRKERIEETNISRDNEYFPELMKNKNHQIWISSRIKKTKSTPKHIILKL